MPTPRCSGAGRATPPLPDICIGVVLLGGPGSGKGTQAVRLAAAIGIPHISTGDLFRDNVERDTRLGRRARRYIDEGVLVPDDVTRAMVRARMDEDDTRWGFILDGYPRTRHQAEVLGGMLTALRRSVLMAIHIRVSDRELLARLGERGRDDDNQRTIRNRLRTFHRYNGPLLEYYRERGPLHEVDGEGDANEVFNRLTAVFPEATGFTTI
ncbi:MAG TPA: adenylate kinase [Acidimicrobiales bacterium]|nr:adenylate kinase [Acidimicrobiales bacterium]